MRQKEIEGTLKPEPLLTENPGRFVLFPIQDNEVIFLFQTSWYSFTVRPLRFLLCTPSCEAPRLALQLSAFRVGDRVS